MIYLDGVDYSNTCSLSWKLVCEGEDVTKTANIEWVVEYPEVLSIDKNGRVRITIPCKNLGYSA